MSQTLRKQGSRRYVCVSGHHWLAFKTPPHGNAKENQNKALKKMGPKMKQIKIKG